MLTAYFFRIGGGVFKTAADISANIASKIDKTIPYFDKRNPATILDITGDCVGKVMGFSADIFSSFILIFIASILFPAVMVNLNLIDAANAVKLEQLPFYIISVAIIVSVISFGFSLYRIKKNHDNFLLEGTYLSLIICSITTYLIINFMQINVNISTIWGKQGYFSLFLPYRFNWGNINCVYFGIFNF
jgi:K(+)-stimulated pyrophosphate-energized sodium pump